MFMRIIWGRIRAGQWERYEAAYKGIFLANRPAIDGLKGRWLVRDVNDPDAGYSVSLWKTAEAMHTYEASDFFRTVVRPALQPYFVDDFTTAPLRGKNHRGIWRLTRVRPYTAAHAPGVGAPRASAGSRFGHFCRLLSPACSFMSRNHKSYRRSAANPNAISPLCPCRLHRQEVELKSLAGTIASLFLIASTSAQAEQTKAAGLMPSADDVRLVAPALEKYRLGPVGQLWKRPDLSPRDRSIATLAALIARNQTIELPRYLELALDHGVKPREISEIITHLAFYAGWAEAMAAVGVAKEVFARRGIGADQLPAASPAPLPLNQAAEAQRAARVGEQFGTVAPGLVQYTTDVLFRDLWLRPGLAPRDRSLVTVSVLIALGQVAQLSSHLDLGMNNGLTRPEIGEVITHLAFYAGWPRAFSALPVAKDVLEKRAR